MAQKKFTELAAADSLTGAEVLALVQDGVSKRTTSNDFVIKAKDYAPVSVSTTGATITLNFSNNGTATFFGSASFATPKTIAHSNDTNAVKYVFAFQITNVAAKLTFPAAYIMSDVRWEGSNPQEWEPAEVGKYKATAIYDGTNWWLDISLSPYV